MMRMLVCGALLLAGGGAVAASAHQHGVASLDAAVDGDMLELTFASPLENLVGFEHAARNDRERKALQAMQQRFSRPQELFVPSPAARCVAEPAEPEMSAAHDGTHADMQVTVRFRCAAPKALRSLELRLYEAFPRLQRVRLQLAAPGRQTGAELNRQRRRIDW